MLFNLSFLWLRQTRRVRNHDIKLELMIGRSSWCMPTTKNKTVMQKFRKLDKLQVLFN
jgi:hypothetical protein